MQNVSSDYTNLILIFDASEDLYAIYVQTLHGLPIEKTKFKSIFLTNSPKNELFKN